MKVTMLKTKKGSPDGCVVNTYLEGKDYDIPKSLADVFIKLQVAKEIVSKFIYVDPPLSNDIDIPRYVEIEIPEKVEIEQPMKTVTKPKRKRGRPKKVK